MRFSRKHHGSLKSIPNARRSPAPPVEISSCQHTLAVCVCVCVCVYVSLPTRLFLSSIARANEREQEKDPFSFSSSDCKWHGNNAMRRDATRRDATRLDATGRASRFCHDKPILPMPKGARGEVLSFDLRASLFLPSGAHR